MNTLANRLDPEPCAVRVSFTETSMRVALADGRELSVPLDWFPRLASATLEQRAAWELLDGGEEIRWEEIDEDVSVSNLLGIRSEFS